MAHFIPSFTDLIKHFRLGFLALIWRWRKYLYYESADVLVFSSCQTGWETSALAHFPKKRSTSPRRESRQLWAFILWNVSKKKSKRGTFQPKSLWSVWKCLQAAERKRTHLTDSVAFPAPAALSEACTVHQVALVVAFVKFLAHFIRESVYNTLIWWIKKKKTQRYVLCTFKTVVWCVLQNYNWHLIWINYRKIYLDLCLGSQLIHLKSWSRYL